MASETPSKEILLQNWRNLLPKAINLSDGVNRDKLEYIAKNIDKNPDLNSELEVEMTKFFNKIAKQLAEAKYNPHQKK